MICSLSKMDDAALEKVKALEQRIGKPILAFACHDSMPASLTGEELSEITDLEKRLGLSLVVVGEKEGKT